MKKQKEFPRQVIGGLLLLAALLVVSRSYCQYASLTEMKMFHNGKQNYFVDTVSGGYYSLQTMDSLYKAGKSPFQIFTNHSSGDSVVWKIVFLKEIPSIRSKWLGQKFPVAGLNSKPVCPVTDAASGETALSRSGFKGKILIINCWSISCPPCLAEIPYLNKLKDSLGSDQYAFIGLTFDHADEIRSFFKSEKLKNFLHDDHPSFHFSIVPGQDSLLNKGLQLVSYPTTFVIDPKGVVREIIEGVDLDEQRKPKVYTEIMDAVKHLN